MIYSQKYSFTATNLLSKAKYLYSTVTFDLYVNGKPLIQKKSIKKNFYVQVIKKSKLKNMYTCSPPSHTNKLEEKERIIILI